jgi:hypothetical protein
MLVEASGVILEAVMVFVESTRGKMKIQAVRVLVEAVRELV